MGSRPSATVKGAKDYFVASESVVLRQLGFGDIVDILPGQAVFCPKGGDPIFRQVVKQNGYTPDTFEYIYVARLESTIDGISVYRSRQKMGEKLAEKIKDVLGEKGVEEIDASKSHAISSKPCSKSLTILQLFQCLRWVILLLW
jgi:amidophosphoribosyltransferase